MSGIREIVKRYVLDQLVTGADSAEITDEVNLKDSGILDSLSTLKLVSFLEEQFNIEVRADDIEAGHLSSFSQIEKFVKGRSAVGL